MTVSDGNISDARPSPYSYKSDGDGGLTSLSGSEQRPGPAVCAAHAALRSFVEHPDYPCVGAKAALARSSYVLGVYEGIRNTSRAPATVADLRWFAEHTADVGDAWVTFLAVFPGTPLRGAEEFERELWKYLQAMHLHDSLECEWDPAVSDDPRDPEFRFSIGGCAFFVIGLHPRARREARRFPFPMLVFNLHSQFEELREEGRFERLRETIRDREHQLEGEPNPLLKDFGSVSEAAQYAGCPHAADWIPPFRPVKGGTQQEGDSA